MKVYIVTYDLNAPGQDYKDLIEAIKTFKWAKIAESCWAIKTDQTAVQVRDYLKSKMDSNDRLFVARLKGEAAWTGLPKKVTEWLKNHLNDQD